MARGREQGTVVEEGAVAAAPSAKDKITVPTNKVGKIIGRRGAMIRELQDKSGATIDVTDATEGGMTVVQLSGTLETIKKAKSLIARTYQDEAQRSPQKSGPNEGDSTIEFEIPEDKCGLVIGSRGSKIREIQQDTGVGVNVGSRDTAVQGLIKVTLTGEAERCENAQKVIMDLISDSDVGGGAGGFEEAKEAQFSTTMSIPADMTRKLIGPQGATIRDIQDKTGAQVDVARRNTVVNGEIVVTLTGAEDCCDSAKDAIKALVEESTGSEQVMMWIEESMCGLIIGSRGSKIRSIQDNSGANVKIDKRNEARDGKVQVTITGNEVQCADAKTEIEDIISESGNKESGDRSFGESKPEHVIKIWVPESKCGMIIGRGGSKISEIQAETRTRVDVNSRERNDNDQCLVTISGPKMNCEDAEKIVNDIVNDAEREGRGPPRGAGGAPRAAAAPVEGDGLTDEERGSMVIWVDTSCLGRIIGKGGAKIREIERSYKVKIDVKKDEQEEHETKVVLIGSKDDVLAARDYIYEIVDEEEE